MKLFFASLFVILSANLLVDLLDSSMSEIINERRETLEKSPLKIQHFWSPHPCKSPKNSINNWLNW